MQLYSPVALEKGVRAEFLTALNEAGPSLVDKFATVVSSSANNEKYGWLGESPQMTELLDELTISSLSEASYTLTNSTYASGISVKRTDLADEQFGGIAMRIRQLAVKAARHPNKLLIDALINGTTNTGYDGAAFFSNTHPARGSSGAQDNLLAGAGTSTANVQSDLQEAIQALMSFKDEAGEPFSEEITNVGIIAPPALMQPIREATQASIISNTSNVGYSGINFEVHFSGRLTDADDWYVMNLSNPLKPLIFQDREPLELVALEGESDAGFMREVYTYKARARYAVGYSHFALACKVVN
tara:strand:+ start:147 stop:1049 length:903 start_codon:yes stop_codon:yes gene_type:complete